MAVPTLKLDVVQVLALAAFGVVLGAWVKKKLPILDRLNIPAPIVGGLLYALVALAVRDRYVNFEMDLVLRDLFMIAFFTTIGLSASWRLIRRGGVQVLWFWVLATVGALLQNLLGVALAKLFGLNPLLGVIAGSGALAGGPATTLAFGPTFEKLGVSGATTLGLASATFGITAAGLLSGYIGGWLVRKHRLQPALAFIDTVGQAVSPACAGQGPAPPESAVSLVRNVLAVAIAMGLGSLISAGISRLGFILPAYIGAMIAAALLRNLDDRFQFAGLSQGHVALIGVISLHLFIVMALLTLRLWELVHLAVPMLVLLFLQVALVWVMCLTAVFRAMGRDYESAVMAGGFCGFMLGITANALASMEELAQKFGPAPQAFIVVPLVGGFLIDFTNALLITVAANLLR
jgi:ESS family glutamate:Na+ symporter